MSEILKYLSLFSLTAFACLLSGCSSEGCLRSGRPSVYDAPFAAGTHERKMRVVSLSPAVTETIFDLGASEFLVGVTDNDDYPEEAKHIPSVGDMHPNFELIAASEPDLIIYDEMFMTAAAKKRLEELSLHSVSVRQSSLKEVRHNLMYLSSLLGISEKGREAVRKFDSDLKLICENKKKLKKNPCVFMGIWISPLTTAGRSSFVSELLEAAGAEGCYSDIDISYPLVSEEDLIIRDPDMIILGMDNPPDLQKLPAWSSLRAVKNGCVFSIEGSLMYRPCLRSLEGIKKIQKCCVMCLEREQ